MGWFHLVELHPILVHFPIALLITSVALDVAALFLRRWRLADTATWCLALGVPGAAVALLSGKISAGYVNTANMVGAEGILHLHKVCAVLASATFGILLAARLAWLAPRLLASLRLLRPGVASAIMGADRSLRLVAPVLYAPRLSRLLVALYLLGSLLGVVLLAATGYLGGSLVYDHGLGAPAGMLRWALAS